jgi:hypothetical protein
MRHLFVVALTTVVLDLASGSSLVLAETLTDKQTTTHGPGGWIFGQDQVLLVVLLIALLALLFWLQMRWSQKLEQASYLGQVYRDSVVEFEFNRLSLAPKAKLNAGEYQEQVERSEWFKENPRPARPAMPPSLERIYGRNRRPGGGPGGLGGPGHITPPGLPNDEDLGPVSVNVGLDTETQKDKRAYEEKYTEWSLNRDAWERKFNQRARSLYNKDVEKAREEAIRNAEKAVDVDLAVLRGRGAAFVLEFTAIGVIIFAAVMLGILNILVGDQIATLLAAIAGYVLGRATTRGGQSGGVIERLQPEPKLISKEGQQKGATGS